MSILKNAILAMLPTMTFLHGALSFGEDPSQTPIASAGRGHFKMM